MPTDRTLIEVWRQNATHWPEREAVIHWVAGAPPVRWHWARLMERADALAHGLALRGVGPADVCAIVVRHHHDFYPLYIAVESLGALPAVLAYPNSRLHPEKFRQGLGGMARRSGLDWILTESELQPVIEPLVSTEGSTIRGLLFPLEGVTGATRTNGPSSPGTEADQPCLLQHSSGTTGLQKAVVLSHRAVLEHVRRYGAAITLDTDDRIVSWLPLYHDMGLIAAFQLALACGVPLVQLDPFEWVSAPVLFLEATTNERGTLAWLPNFAYNLMADRVSDEDLDGVDLSTLRLLVNCSEPVRAGSHDRFLARYASRGLRPEVLGASYAMAETTFAVTQTPPGQEARRVFVDRKRLATGAVTITTPLETSRPCVSSGRPISGCSIRAVGEDRSDVAPGQVGELAIRSVSMFDGYRHDPEKTAEVLADGWYYSGDYGFEHDGDWFVIGRKKDLIIVAGKNVYPEDVEDAISSVPGILPGRVVAFGIEDESVGTEQICIVAETDRTERPELKALRLAVLQAGMQIDVTITRLYFAPPRWLIKSSSGKPSRKANRDRALTDLEPY